MALLCLACAILPFTYEGAGWLDFTASIYLGVIPISYLINIFYFRSIEVRGNYILNISYMVPFRRRRKVINDPTLQISNRGIPIFSIYSQGRLVCRHGFFEEDRKQVEELKDKWRGNM